MGWRRIGAVVVAMATLAARADATLSPTSLAGNAAFSAAVFAAFGTPNTTHDEMHILGDWDGREDLVADHDRLVFDWTTYAPLPASNVVTRFVSSYHTGANGFPANFFYAGHSSGQVWIGIDGNLDGVMESGLPLFDVHLMIAGMPSGILTFANPTMGDSTSTSVVITGIAVNPVADMGPFDAAKCGIVGEAVYVSAHDVVGGALDSSAQPVHTRIFAFGFYEESGSPHLTNVYQILRHHLGNVAGVSVDDGGSLYFQLADLTTFGDAAIFKATEVPHTSCTTANRVNRVIEPFLLDGALNVASTTPVDTTAVHVTNFSGDATTFGNVVAMANGPCNTLYAAVSRSFVDGDDAATKATEGRFTNPAGLGATPAMVVTLADGAGALDRCTSPGGSQPGILPIDDGVADVADAAATPTAGVNNFRAFVLGTGPDRRAAGDRVFGDTGTTQQVALQVDWSLQGFSGIMVDEENAVHVISGGAPAGSSPDSSPDVGEILKFPDRRPFDRRADRVDLRGHGAVDPPNPGDATPDGAADRFDYAFAVAPDDGGGHPTGVSGLGRGFLRVLNRTSDTPITNLPNGMVQGDDTHAGPLDFDDFDPSGQVAGGDDALAPNTGDDANGGFEFSFGGVSSGMCETPWTQFFLNSNGNLTFGAGDDDNTPTPQELLGNQPRVAPAWMDWNPNARAATVAQFPVQALGFAAPNAFKVRWIDAPPFGSEACGGKATMSVTLYDDGTGNDESSFGTPEGPTSGAPRPDGSGNIRFDYCRFDYLATPGQPVLIGYSRGGQDPASPGVAETNLSALMDRDGANTLFGNPTKAVFYEQLDGGLQPMPQVDGKIGLDFRFTSNDPRLTTAPQQAETSHESLLLNGIDCTATSLTCPYDLVITPLGLSAASTFDTTLAAQGGKAPFSYAVTSGALPAGVALDATTGHLAGGSAQSGPFTFAVTATDANQCTVTQSYTVQASCFAGPTFPSLACRLDALTTAVAGLGKGKFPKALGKLVAKAKKLEAAAKAKNDVGKAAPAKRGLVKMEKTLAKMEKTLNGKKGAKAIPDAGVRASITGLSSGIRTDSAALRTQI